MSAVKGAFFESHYESTMNAFKTLFSRECVRGHFGHILSPSRFLCCSFEKLKEIVQKLEVPTCSNEA